MTKQLSWTSVVLFVLLLVFVGISCSPSEETPRILIFSKTEKYRHASIPAGIEALKALCAKHGILVDTTENADNFNEENLRKYHAVIFLSTTGDVLNKKQQNDFERFIQAGGGFVGIHAATDTEYNWPWYNGLVGAYFESHPQNPNVRTGEFYVTDPTHPATDSLPERFSRADEFYSFKSIKSDLIHVILKIDEESYEGGTNGDDHPMAWSHEYDGGRAFYTAMGHTEETFKEPLFLTHIWGGLRYVLGGEKAKKLNYKLAHTIRVPEENRFTKVVLDEKLNEPVELVVMKDGKVLFIERRGAVKLYDPSIGKTKLIYELPVSHTYKFKDNGRDEAEDGLLGLGMDPDFENNHWIYLYYSLAGDKPVNVLTRWDFKNDQLVESSRKVILEVDVQREQCCHTGGSIDWDADGNLYLSTGDNTSPRDTRYAPIDERPGRSPWDAQKGSANTNDLRGKVIRIHPEPDGTYTIPKGNLFPEGTEKTRPEIYIMGGRNPYRISVDKKTGFLYWGDVGPDANNPDSIKGPAGYDEINQARKPGFFGWPYFVGNNQPYNDYNFETKTSGPKFDPQHPVNESPNNTGLRELPPVSPPFIWYPYAASAEFPLVGTGGRTAMAGPVFYSSDFKKAKRPFPDYYDGKLFIYEWVRGWIMVVTMDGEGNYVDMEPFMPDYKFSNPMDMTFGPDGDLYLLEYGTGWFQQNDNARLVRIEYNPGNRKPQVVVAASKQKGALPLAVTFSSAGTKDFDRDELKYEWTITDNNGKKLASYNDPNPSHTFNESGTYQASLTVTDTKGEKASAQLQILAGNEPPVVTIDIPKGNQEYFLTNIPVQYKVKVTDKEDGSLAEGTIPAEAVSVTIDYLKEGFDKIEVAQGHFAADENIQFAAGKRLVEASDCKACHQVSQQSVGPMYIDVAKKYRNDPKAGDMLIKKVINGGSGNWGDVAMAAHPNLSIEDAGQMVKYILSLGSEKPVINLPIEGTYNVPKGDAQTVPGQGVIIIRASYQDKGANGIAPIKEEKVLVLKNSTIPISSCTSDNNVNRFTFGTPPVTYMMGSKGKAYVAFSAVDLTDIKQIEFAAGARSQYNQLGGRIEIRLDSPDGKLIGTSNPIIPLGPTAPPKPSVVTANIEPQSGKKHLFLIYRNEDAKGESTLFSMSWMTLVP